MKQLALDFAAPPTLCFENFLPGQNAEALVTLARIARGEGSERSVFIWGGRGCGRTHLLHAVVAEALAHGRPAVYLPSRAAPGLADVSEDTLVALDDVEQLDAVAQIESFGFYNRALVGTGALVASGAAAPGSLGLRADLATRLAWGLVYEIHALSDEDKTTAMRLHAVERGFELPNEVVQYLLRHAPRDLPTLLVIVDQLDRSSLEAHRPISIALAREVLASAHAVEKA